jgi:hypothetical protein
LTPRQHENLVVTWIAEWVRRKYKAGQVEHGGKLWRKRMMPHVIEEIVDLVVYIFTMHSQLLQIEELLIIALDQHHIEDMHSYVNDALNVLQVGNVEGVEEEELNG